ncbi:MAG TPA: AAA family ATPase [Actinomycetota bacterium]|jgi:chloramphenicol 3-O phosphotransferase
MTERIVLLNGTSSAGKTTVARCLQRTLEPQWLFLEFDQFVEMLTDTTPNPSQKEDGEEFGHWLAEGWYRAVGGLAGVGFDLVVEDVILEPYRLHAAIRRLAPFDVTFVAVHCPLEVAVQRERDRGDRDIGLVRHQFDLVHTDRTYDCEVDTSTMEPEACVATIQRVVDEGGVRAFDLMKSALDT